MCDETPEVYDPSQPIVVGFSGWWSWVAAVAGLALPISLLVWQFRGAARFSERLAPGLEALAAGNPGRAAELFGELAHRYRTRVNERAVALFNQGVALTRAGNSA